MMKLDKQRSATMGQFLNVDLTSMMESDMPQQANPLDNFDFKALAEGSLFLPNNP